MAYAGRDLGVLPPSAELSEQAFVETARYWRAWSGRLASEAPNNEAAIRSAITLKLLTFAPSGAIVAAPTTSLPESPGGVRNWDYRYTWIRDASWTIDALTSVGHGEEATAYLTWAINAARTSRPFVHSLYSLYGAHHIRERTIRGLRGYRDSRPVRQGNAAVAQLQLDNWGHLVDLAWTYAVHHDGLDRETWNGIRALVGFVADNWRRPDHGMWEVRSAPQHFVHSKVMAWVALDRGVRLANDFRLRAPIARWEAARDELRATVLERGIDDGSFIRAFGSTEVDAALLLISRTGFVPPDDHRMLRTIERVRAELGQEDLVYRYLGADGVPGHEGAFLPGSFWLAETHAAAGKLDEARGIFAAAAARANDVGLLPEEIDVATGQFLGNYPQALSHIALVNALAAINRAEQAERMKRFL
jgi:GH15 family glucan-1,4-alpha-glucosidase